MELVSMGAIFRRQAQERCMSLEEFGMLAGRDESIDRELDEEQKKIAGEKDNIILEGRLSGFLVNAVLKVWLKASPEVRAERIAQREGKPVAKAMAEASEREQCERERYLNYYNIDIKDLSIYDLVIDSSKWSPEEIGEIVVKATDFLL
jgi:cytidylate kinase